jgi:peptide chain release factor 2
VHRLVRKSPFDSGNRRHTSFASVFVSPEIDDDIEIEINPADLKTDVPTARAAPVASTSTRPSRRCASRTCRPASWCVPDERSSTRTATRDEDAAAKLYELEVQEAQREKQALEDSKSDIGWGSQIRSYVLDQSRIKDLRTGVETSNTQAVLDGDLDQFIEASLKRACERPMSEQERSDPVVTPNDAARRRTRTS